MLFHSPHHPSQWNPCRSRGARCPVTRRKLWLTASLSGTPAEAGVRGYCICDSLQCSIVSVEPLPKQGCEGAEYDPNSWCNWSQWNPCRSRGASRLDTVLKQIETGLSGTPAEAGVREGISPGFQHNVGSQWNPCRSRGARGKVFSERRGGRCCLSGTPAEAGVRVGLRRGSGQKRARVSVEPLPKQGCEVQLESII